MNVTDFEIPSWKAFFSLSNMNYSIVVKSLKILINFFLFNGVFMLLRESSGIFKK